jgi:phosphatidylinositol glycan class C protein
MTISFRQDPFDGRCLNILSQSASQSMSVPSSVPAPILEVTDEDEPRDNGWKRVLYEKNGDFPDNYTPDSFLSSLSVNMDLKIYEYIPSMRETVKAVSIHACLIPIFFILYYLLRSEQLNPMYLIAIDIILLVSGYAAREYVIRHLLSLTVFSNSVNTFGFASPRTQSGASAMPSDGASSIPSPQQAWIKPSVATNDPQWFLLRDLQRAFLVFGTVYILSPLLRTLTRSWSEDTILAIAVSMFIVHLIFHDYTFVSKTKTSLEYWHQLRGDVDRITRSWKKVDHSVALNAIIFSAIVLASRLHSFESVFGFVFFSMTAFAFLPFVLKLINLENPDIFLVTVCPGAVILTSLFMYLITGVLLTVVFTALLVFVVFVCPYVLVKSFSLKKTIKGPWDIAHVNRRVVPPTPMGGGGNQVSISYIMAASPMSSPYSTRQ